MTRVNIAIPEELHKKLKLHALKSDQTLKDFIIDTLEKKSGGAT